MTTSTDQRGQFDQWATYRHPDGAVVFVAQTKQNDGGKPALGTLPLTTQQLATLATSEALHLD